MLRPQDLLRKKITDHFKKDPKTLSIISKEIGTSLITLRNFLLLEGVLQFKTWILVDNYVDRLELKEKLHINENKEKE